MTVDPATVSPSMSVVEAAKEMIQKEKGPLPVVEGGRVVAMVTDRDIIARVVAAGQDPSALWVSDIATKDLVTIGPDQDAQEARQLMAQHQLDRLLVVEEGDRLVGSSRKPTYAGTRAPGIANCRCQRSGGYPQLVATAADTRGMGVGLSGLGRDIGDGRAGGPAGCRSWPSG